MVVIALVATFILSCLLQTSTLYRTFLCLSYVCIVSCGQTDTQLTVRYNKKFIEFKTAEFNKFSDCMSSRWISSCSAITNRKRTDVTSSIDKVSHTTRNHTRTGVGVKQCSVWTTLDENTSTTEITCQYTGSHRCDLTITVNSTQNRSVTERKKIVFSFGWDVGAYHYFDITDHNRESIRVEKCETVRSKILRPTASRYAVSFSTLPEITVSTTAVRKYSSVISAKAIEANRTVNSVTILPTTSGVGAVTRLTNDLGVVLVSQGTPSSRSQGNATPDVSTLKLTVVVLALAVSVPAITVTATCICMAWHRRAERTRSPFYCSPLRGEHRRDSHDYTAPFNGVSVSAGQGLDINLYDVDEDDVSAPVNRAQAHAGNILSHD